MQQNPNVYSTGTCILRARYSRQRHQQLFNLRIVVTLDKVQKGICNRDALNKRQYTLLKKILTSLRFYHSFSEKKTQNAALRSEFKTKYFSKQNIFLAWSPF